VVILLDSGAAPSDTDRQGELGCCGTEEYSGSSAGDDTGIAAYEPTSQAAPTPVADVPAAEEQPTSDQSGSGQSSGGVGGVTTGGGTGGSGTSGGGIGEADPSTEAVLPEEEALASDTPSARATEPLTPTPDLGAIAITDAPDADAKDGSAAESAADDEGGNGGDLPIIEILLALGAITALGASIVLARRRRDQAA
jgi:hypothetical protein